MPPLHFEKEAGRDVDNRQPSPKAVQCVANASCVAQNCYSWCLVAVVCVLMLPSNDVVPGSLGSVSTEVRL